MTVLGHRERRGASALHQDGRRAANEGLPLPGWPLALPLAGYPLWWVMGIGDMVWPIAAVIMVFLLLRSKNLTLPRGFGIWLLFIVFMTASIIEIDTFGRLIGFIYRAALYLSATVVLVYVYNARQTLTLKYLGKVLTIFWLVVVAGGYLAVFFPLLSFATPLSYVLPKSLLANELVQEMAFRRTTQFNPDAWVVLEPRPSAPFLYTNAWGNVYSVLTPIVLAYLGTLRRQRSFWWLALCVPLSLVPAFLTLNRGMFIGLGIAAICIAVRSALSGNFRMLGALAGLGVLVAVAFVLLPIQERLSERLDSSSTTADRANLYEETFSRTMESPIFGFGAPRPSTAPGIPSAGTQGQVWMVMFSHGFLAITFFVAFLLWAFIRSLKARSGIGLTMSTSILVVLVEIFYYGIVGTGLCLAMIAIAATLRPPDPTPLPAGGATRTARSVAA